MKEQQKPLFELPKLIALDGSELTEDDLLREALEGNSCDCGSGGNCCSGGSSEPIIK